MVFNIINFNKIDCTSNCFFPGLCKKTDSIQPSNIKKSKTENSSYSINKNPKELLNHHLLIDDIVLHVINTDYEIIYTIDKNYTIDDNIKNKKISDVYSKETTLFFLDILNIVKNTKEYFRIIVNIDKKSYKIKITPILNQDNDIYGYIYFKIPYSETEHIK
jgi:hypothetical protein